MSTDPRRAIIQEADRLLVAMARVGFSAVAVKRMAQAIEWMESETPAETSHDFAVRVAGERMTAW